MPFDPNKPANGSPNSSAEMRAQLNGLKDLIAEASGVTSVVIDSVTTLPAGSQAVVSASVNGAELHFSFQLPQGQEGQQGIQGVIGPPFATAVVDGVNTLPPGSNAAVNTTFDGTNVRFTFDLPQGHDGATGPPGPPGEVSQTDLNNGLLNNLSQCSNNSNGVDTLGQNADGSYNQSQMQDMINKVNELILALRR